MRRLVLMLHLLGCGGGDDGAPDADGPPAGADDTDASPTDSEPHDTDAAADSDAPSLRPPLPTFVGGFTDLTAATWDDGAYAAVFDGEPSDGALLPVDLDGDGVLELLVEGPLPLDEALGRRGPVLAWDAAAGGYAIAPALGRRLVDEALFGVVGVVDVDGDGHDDLLSFRTGPDDALLRLGDGAGGFVAGDVRLAPDRKFAFANAYPFDLDEDGWLDVVLGQSCASDLPPITLLHRVGPRAWEERADLGVPDPNLGVRQLGIVPVPGGDPWIAAMGFVCDSSLSGAPGILRRAGTTADGLPTWAPWDPLGDDVWYRHTPEVAGASLNDVAPMGGLVLDDDGDGVLDLFVAAALDYVLALAVDGPGGVRDRSLDVGVRFPNLDGTTEREPWSIAALDLDLDGRPDLAISQGADYVFTSMGPDDHVSYTRLYWNDGGGFQEVPDALGLAARPADWHTLLLEDVDGDLDADLLVGGYGALPRVWRNDLDPTGYKLVLRLRGTTSNHLGVGAIVRVEAPGMPPQTRFVGEQQPTNRMAAPTLWLGTGTAAEVDVTVTWPSGLVQRFAGLATDAAHTLEEAPTLRVADADRSAPADGASRVEVILTPRDLDGALAPAATVTLEQVEGAARWAGPATWDGAAWRRTLIAPAAPGASRVRATVDGVPLRVRPRVRWTAAP